MNTAHRVAVIGTGHWGKNLLRNFHALGALKAACDIRSDLKETVSRIAPGIPFYTNPEPVLSDPDIKGVIISTSAREHASLTRSALLAGKDVFVEKPLALSLENGRELVKLAESRGLILMVGHILHYHPAFIKLKEIIESGELGGVRYIYSNRLNIGKIRMEENILWSFAPHDISIVLSLLKEYPVRLSCNGGCYINPGIYDVTMTQMMFPSGVRGHIFVSWLHPFKEQRLVVVGSDKMAVIDDMSEHKLLLYPHIVKWEGLIPTAVKAEAEVIETDHVEPLKSECIHFLDCIENRKKPYTDGHEALRVLSILEACRRSLENEGEPVSLQPEQSPRQYFAHESAFIDKPCQIGPGTKIWHFSHIMKGARIGQHCTIGQNVYIGSKAVIGNFVKIQNNVSVYDDVILEDYVFCGPSMVFTNVMNPRAEIDRKHEYQRTIVRHGATLGANCTIVCGHTIGRYAFVAAGSVVTRDIPDFALVGGVPAIRIGWVCRCGETLYFSERKACCPACGTSYLQVNTHRIIPESHENKDESR